MKSWKVIAVFITLCFISLTTTPMVSAIPNYNLSKLQIQKKIVRESLKQGLDPALTLGLVEQESAFDKNARSYVGAIGLFQLMPQTARELGVNPHKVDDNIKGGIKYIKMMKRKFGSTKLALAAYNAGPGAVQRYRGIPPYRETRNYVRNIMRNIQANKRNPCPAIAMVLEENEKLKHNKMLCLRTPDPVENIKEENRVANLINPMPNKPLENFFISIINTIMSFFA